jgi:formylglycine-generating enzyme required for sulfatase activity
LFSLVDMTGNAWHWTADWYRADYFQLPRQQYSNGSRRRPSGRARAAGHVQAKGWTVASMKDDWKTVFTPQSR